MVIWLQQFLNQDFDVEGSVPLSNRQCTVLFTVATSKGTTLLKEDMYLVRVYGSISIIGQNS